MERLGQTFGEYRIQQAALARAAWTMYRATTSHGTRVVYRGVASTTSRTVSLWVSDVLDDVSVVIPMLLKQTNGINDLDHPALARVLDAGELGGRIYFVTPYLEGMTLDELIRRGGPLPVGEAVRLLTPIADGLDHAHSAGLVHGAISPTTIWVDSSSDDGAAALLVGYGLDALLRSHVRHSEHDDDIAPDVLYLAPDQLRADTSAADDAQVVGETVADRYSLRQGAPDESADQYALACALYHCVTGRSPFTHDTVAGLLEAHALMTPPDAPTVGAAAERAIHQGMAKRPTDRHLSCLALMQAMGTDRHTAAPAYIAQPRHRERRRSPQRASGHGIGWWVGIALLTSLVLVTVVLLTLAVTTFFQ